MKLLGRIHKVGTIASLTCALHCMLMPLVIAFLPLLGLGFLAHRSFDKWMLIIGIILPLPDLCWGFKRHKSTKAFWLLLAGFMWWWLAHEQRFEWQHFVCIALCGFSFLWSNLMNRSLCKSCTHCEHDHKG